MMILVRKILRGFKTKSQRVQIPSTKSIHCMDVTKIRKVFNLKMTLSKKVLTEHIYADKTKG